MHLEGMWVVEEMAEKLCENCGESLREATVFCPRCGARIVQSSEYEEEPSVPGFWRRNQKIIIIGIIVVLGILAVLCTMHFMQVSELKKQLVREWLRVEGEEDSSILCILDFTEDEIEYRVETGYAWIDTTIDTFKYKVVSGNKMKVLSNGKWKTITVEFNEDRIKMKITPALTSMEESESWFSF